MLGNAGEKRGYFLLNLVAAGSATTAETQDSYDCQDRDDGHHRHKSYEAG